MIHISQNIVQIVALMLLWVILVMPTYLALMVRIKANGHDETH